MGAVEKTIVVGPTGLVTRKAAAEALMRKPKTLADWSSRGIGPETILVHGRAFYRWSDIQAFADGAA